MRRRQKETDNLLASHSADMAQLQRELGVVAAGVPPPPEAGPTWSREVDRAVMAVTSKAPLMRAAVEQAMAPVLGDAQLAEASRVEGDDLGQRFVVRMAGDVGLAERRVRKLVASLRGGGPGGTWRQVSATTPTGHAAPLSLSKDKNSRQVSYEITLEKMRRALEEGLSKRIFVDPVGPDQLEGTLSLAWQPLVKIAMEGPGSAPVVQWNAAVLRRHQLPREQLEQLVEPVLAPTTAECCL